MSFIPAKLSALFARSPPAEAAATPKEKEAEDAAAVAVDPRLAQAAAAAAAPPPLPKHLPSRADIQVDVLEWLLYVALHQTDPLKLNQHVRDIDDLLPDMKDPPGYGRISSRLELTGFYVSVCNKETEANPMGPGLPTSSPIPPFALAEWRAFPKDLAGLRRRLLRRDANLPVPVQVVRRGRSDDSRATFEDEEEDDDDQPPVILPENSEIDPDLEQRDMMQSEYQELLRLFQVQEAMADLQIELQKIQKDRPRSVTTRVEKALQVYSEAVLRIFRDAPDGIPSQLAIEASLGGQKQSALVDKVFQTIQDVCLNDDDAFSHAQVQHKTRVLLIKWSGILDTPSLVKLGYGGVTAPEDDVELHGDDEDDVSSLGQPEQVPLETQEAEPLPFRRSKFAPSATKEAAFGAAPEEQVLLEQLSRGACPPPLTEGQSLVIDEVELEAVAVFRGQPTARQRESPVHRGVAPVERVGRDRAPIDQDIRNHGPKNSERTEALARRPSSTPAGARHKRKLADEPDLNSDDDSWLGLRTYEKKGRKRVPWTEEETSTVMEGIEHFGAGKWAQIKAWAGPRLQNRDTVAIKDKYRNIMGQI